MSARPFQQIDVFTAAPGYGNPVAVVLDGGGLDDAAISDALQGTAFFNWANRLMLSLGEPLRTSS